MWNRTYFVTSAVVSNSFHIAWKRLLSLAHFASIHFRLNFRTFAVGLVFASNSDKCRATLSYRFTCWTAHLFSTRPSLTTICSFNDQRHSCKKCWIMKNELSVWSSIGVDVKTAQWQLCNWEKTPDQLFFRGNSCSGLGTAESQGMNIQHSTCGFYSHCWFCIFMPLGAEYMNHVLIWRDIFGETKIPVVMFSVCNDSHQEFHCGVIACTYS